MKIARIAPYLGFTPQLRSEDLSAVASAGFASVVNNRPDGEERGQPSSGELRAAAERCRLTYRHIPVASGRIGKAEIAAFEDAIDRMPRPVLAFCRTARARHRLRHTGGAARVVIGTIAYRARSAPRLSILLDRFVGAHPLQ